MSSFRPIQPAPIAKRDLAPGGDELASIATKFGKRIRSVAQACHVCRQIKAKCDGERPKCGHCTAKGKPCGYEGEAGQSRQAAMKTRLEALEKLFNSLQAQTPDEAANLLERIRAAEDVTAALDTPKSASRESSSSDIALQRTSSRAMVAMPSGPTTPASASSSRESAPITTNSPTTTITTSSPTTTITTNSPTTTITTNSPTTTLVQSSKGYNTDGHSSTAVSPAASGQLTPGITWGWIRLTMPNPSSTKEAVDSFFGCSGKLFHVFSRAQTDILYRIVFEDDTSVSAREKMAAVCCLTAVAAVGVQYSHGQFTAGAEVAFYDISRHCFDFLLDTDSLDVIKVCTLFAMYNIMGKATVSLAYVEVGLGMSRRQGLNNTECCSGKVGPEAWVDYRRAWRTLIFFSSWLSSTLGYISGDDFLTRKIPLNDLDVERSADISSIVQAEMAKICLLKADILRMHLAFKDLTIVSIETIMKDLQEWYGRLPSEMHIANLGRGDIPTDVRRSIYHVHLLYLGATILLYRRIASQFVRSYATEKERDDLWKPLERLLISNTEEGILAAKHSSRILGMLYAEDGVFKRCWLVIFQSYTSCLLILHSIAQKQLHNFPRAVWDEELEQAQQCLTILSFCGTVDPVARKFHGRLTAIYDDIARYNPVDSVFDTSGKTIPAPPEYLLTIPSTADQERINLSFSLLVLLCRPFGDAEEEEIRRDVKEHSRADPSRYEAPQLIERLEWDYENSRPFQWDMDQLGLQGLRMRDLEADSAEEGVGGGDMPDGESFGSDESTEEDSDDGGRRKRRCTGSRFLMSRHPSGWMDGEGYMF